MRKENLDISRLFFVIGIILCIVSSLIFFLSPEPSAMNQESVYKYNRQQYDHELIGLCLQSFGGKYEKHTVEELVKLLPTASNVSLADKIETVRVACEMLENGTTNSTLEAIEFSLNVNRFSSPH
jgi:hypothetical protein